jgi:hypothetical protein
MDLTVNIGFAEVLKLVKQLPASKIMELQGIINRDFISKKAKQEITSFQEFLLKAPVMSDKQFEQFNENRKTFSQWRAKN